jgi:UDP-N-acetylmuramyl tripeptide synthase
MTNGRPGHRACTARGLELLTVGEQGETIRSAARRAAGAGAEVVHDGVERQVNLPLIGAYQAANALVSAGLALASGMTARRCSMRWGGLPRCAGGWSARG